MTREKYKLLIQELNITKNRIKSKKLKPQTELELIRKLEEVQERLKQEQGEIE